MLRIRWESLVAGGLTIIFFATRPPSMDNGIPYLLERSTIAFSCDLILLAAVFGLSISVVRRKDTPGRFACLVMLIFSLFVLIDWLHLLLNWKARWWG